MLPNRLERDAKPIGLVGIVLLVGMILSLLYGLKNLDVFAFWSSVRSTSVWPDLLGFLVALPLFILGYLTDRGIGLTLVLSALTGGILMGVFFVSQLSENAVRIASGSGGYFVTNYLAEIDARGPASRRRSSPRWARASRASISCTAPPACSRCSSLPRSRRPRGRARTGSS